MGTSDLRHQQLFFFVVLGCWFNTSRQRDNDVTSTKIVTCILCIYTSIYLFIYIYIYVKCMKIYIIYACYVYVYIYSIYKTWRIKNSVMLGFGTILWWEILISRSQINGYRMIQVLSIPQRDAESMNFIPRYPTKTTTQKTSHLCWAFGNVHPMAVFVESIPDSVVSSRNDVYPSRMVFQRLPHITMFET